MAVTGPHYLFCFTIIKTNHRPFKAKKLLLADRKALQKYREKTEINFPPH